jgi:nucleotide-binding universal stress UspA family protein
MRNVMAIKDILVQVDRAASCRNRFEIAARLAESFDAHLTGIFVVPPLHIPVYTGIAVPTAMAQIAAEYKDDLAASAKTLFQELESSWESRVSWVVEEDEVSIGITRHAGTNDLLVVGQHDKNDSGDINAGVVERVCLSSGRPVLVVPYNSSGSIPGGTVMVAWNGRREAIRAVHDSMPFLEAANAVHVVSVGNHEYDELPGVDLAEHLARHGITVETESVSNKGGSDGEILLALARRYGADMMVMGAYGHSMVRETVLGGASRYILREMNIPLLMSH